MDNVQIVDHPDITKAFELKRGTNDVYLVIIECKTDDVLEQSEGRANALAAMLTSLNVCALVMLMKDTTMRVVDLKREPAS